MLASGRSLLTRHPLGNKPGYHIPGQLGVHDPSAFLHIEQGPRVLQRGKVGARPMWVLVQIWGVLTG